MALTLDFIDAKQVSQVPSISVKGGKFDVATGGFQYRGDVLNLRRIEMSPESMFMLLQEKAMLNGSIVFSLLGRAAGVDPRITLFGFSVRSVKASWTTKSGCGGNMTVTMGTPLVLTNYQGP